MSGATPGDARSRTPWLAVVLLVGEYVITLAAI